MSLSLENQRPIAADNTVAVAVYALYGLGYFFVIPAVIGVVIAHAYANADDVDPVTQSHFRFQIRTFWIGLLYNLIAFPLCLVLIGFPILAWWVAWSLARIVKGFLLIRENKPIANPRSWLFG
jgi:uncharacterized membrane protein